jgi:hypothetical protein
MRWLSDRQKALLAKPLKVTTDQTAGAAVASSIDGLIATLSSPLTSDREWNALCVNALAALANPSTAILSFLEQLTSSHRSSLFDWSHDTATHFKWLLYRSQEPRFTLWLHQYKEVNERGLGYAQVPHNHRYDIASLILSGGYTAVDWQGTDDGIRQADSQDFHKGDIMAIEYDRIHSLLAIEPYTLTLVIEGRRIIGFSTAYYPPDYTPRIFPDFQSRWPDLEAALRNA